MFEGISNSISGGISTVILEGIYELLFHRIAGGVSALIHGKIAFKNGWISEGIYERSIGKNGFKKKTLWEFEVLLLKEFSKKSLKTMLDWIHGRLF